MAKHLPDPGKEQPDASEARWLVPWTLMSGEKQHPKKAFGAVNSSDVYPNSIVKFDEF